MKAIKSTAKPNRICQNINHWREYISEELKRIKLNNLNPATNGNRKA
jgi:hypothetical protein